MALTELDRWSGHVGVSTDGWGSLSQSGVISATVPSGATVVAAYLYSTTYGNASNPQPTPACTFHGTSVTFGTHQTIITPTSVHLGVARADVTAIVAGVIDNGPGGTYNFAITEDTGADTTQAGVDGEALVVVYELASLPVRTIVVYDGTSATGGAHFVFDAGAPMPTADPNFHLELRLGISHSFNVGDTAGQVTTIGLNSPSLAAEFTGTNGLLVNCGNYNDGEGSVANGMLITVGGDDDGYAPRFPPAHATVLNNTERFDLTAKVLPNAQTMGIYSENNSHDDLLFLAVFIVTERQHIIGSTVFGVNTTVTATRAFAAGLDGNTNVHNEAGKFKIFGDFEVTGDVTIGGSTTFADNVEANEGVTQTRTVTLPSANLLTLRATPQTIVAAPGPGYVLEFVSAVVFLDAADAYTETDDNLAVKYGNGSGVQVSETIEMTGFIDQASDRLTTVQALPDAITTKAGAENQPLVLHNIGDGEFAGGTGGVRVKVSYRVWRTDWSELIPNLVLGPAFVPSLETYDTYGGGGVLPPS